MKPIHLPSGTATKIVGAFLGASFALHGQPAHSQVAQTQPSEIELLRQQVAELQARLERLEAAKNAPATPNAPAATPAATPATPNGAVPTVTSNSKLPIVVSGLLQVHALDFASESRRSGGLVGVDTFRLRRGEIRLTAPAITDRISGVVMIDPAKVVAQRGSTSTSVIRERDNPLQDIQLSYQLSKSLTGPKFIDVGQFKIPVGYESLLSSGGLQTVERALLFTQRDPFDGGFGDVRDTGIQLRGTAAGQFDFRLGLFNGLGDRQNGLALSDAKAILGRLAYRPRRAQGLEIGVSGGRGNTGVNSFITVTNPAGVTTTTNVVRRDNRSLFNAFLAYKRDKLSLQSEFLRGQAAPISVGANTVAGRDIQGYYGSLGYLFRPQIEGVLRYDHFDSNRDVSNADLTDITLGLNYYLKGNNAKIQSNLVRRSSNPGAPAALRNDRYEVRTNFQVAF